MTRKAVIMNYIRLAHQTRNVEVILPQMENADISKVSMFVIVHGRKDVSLCPINSSHLHALKTHTRHTQQQTFSPLRCILYVRRN